MHDSERHMQTALPSLLVVLGHLHAIVSADMHLHQLGILRHVKSSYDPLTEPLNWLRHMFSHA